MRFWRARPLASDACHDGWVGGAACPGRGTRWRLGRALEGSVAQHPCRLLCRRQKRRRRKTLSGSFGQAARMSPKLAARLVLMRVAFGWGKIKIKIKNQKKIKIQAFLPEQPNTAWQRWADLAGAFQNRRPAVAGSRDVGGPPRSIAVGGQGYACQLVPAPAPAPAPQTRKRANRSWRFNTSRHGGDSCSCLPRPPGDANVRTRHELAQKPAARNTDWKPAAGTSAHSGLAGLRACGLAGWAVSPALWHLPS